MKDKSLLALQYYIPNRKIIDIGCVGMSDKWTKYDFIKNLKPSYYLGVDIVDALYKKEQTAYCNIENQDDVWNIVQSHGCFDVIVLYDILEHLDNVGLAVENIINLMRKETMILISTPNAISDKWVQQIRDGGKAKINTDHVHWFCEQTLFQLFNRYGYKLVKTFSAPLEPRLVQVFTYHFADFA